MVEKNYLTGDVDRQQHINTAIVSRPPGKTYGSMYSMHRYWSKKASDVIAAYIECYTKPGEIVLDPFCGSGVVTCEAIRLGRKSIAIDVNPMATFITKMTLTPQNLSQLQWIFNDLKSICERAVSELYTTICFRCGKEASIEFVVREGNTATQIAYKCGCSINRLFKEPTEQDKKIDHFFAKHKIPYWYPKNVRIPIIQREKFQYQHELFTKRNLIALSIILNEIEKIVNERIREIMKFAFTATLDKCSKLKPLSLRQKTSHPSLSESWVAVRYFTPRNWMEVNPWYAFERSFNRIYKGKKESNDKLRNAILGCDFNDLYGDANFILLEGSADKMLDEYIPDGSIHYVLTDPPFGAHIQYLALSSFWGAWLKFDFNYEEELIVNHYRDKKIEDYEFRFGKILKSIRRVIKPNRYIHIFYHDIRGPYLHKLLKLMTESKIVPEKILHQPPPNSFGAGVRNISKTGKGHYGNYIIRGKAIEKNIPLSYIEPKRKLEKKIDETSRIALEIREGNSALGSLLHSIYQRLSKNEILTFAHYNANDFLKKSIEKYAVIKGNMVRLIQSENKSTSNKKIKQNIRVALLDTKSLYVNEVDKQNQVYQRVLGKFQENGITIGDIHLIEKNIQDIDVKDYRKKRLKNILYLFGRILNFKSIKRSEAYEEVIWEADGNVKISFRVKDDSILVNASKTIPEEDIGSDVGTISDNDLEYALFNWCEKNSPKGDKLKEKIYPMEKSIQTSTPQHLLLKVLDNKQVCPQHYLITLEVPKEKYFDLIPGQFFHIICDPDGENTLLENGIKRGYALTLRRPFSVYRVHYANFNRKILATPTVVPYELKKFIKRPINKIEFLYKVVGIGTTNLSEIKKNKLLDLIGPIGNGFNVEKGEAPIEKVVLVAGGIGVAPLVALAERFRYLGSSVYLYYGALKKELLRLLKPDSAVSFGFTNGKAEFIELVQNEFNEIGTERVRICTDDGSDGEKGPVTDVLEKDLKLGELPKEGINLYTCGPLEMMKKVSKMAKEYNIPCQLLMEERMACGIGACFSCTCKVKSQNGKIERKRVCVDGPVFDSEDIKW